ncbi:SprT family zinc-dependent metalloprotease [Thiolapillus sp.]
MNRQALEQALRDATAYWLAAAEKQLGRHFPLPEIRFDLRGQAAGQYRGHPLPCIRYNLELAGRQPEAFLRRTPGHEVAHYVIHQMHPRQRLRPHGPEWRQLMESLGLEPSRCHEFDTGGVTTRRQRRFSYRCACRKHELSATRHNRVIRGQAEYRCTHCGERLVAQSRN